MRVLNYDMISEYICSFILVFCLIGLEVGALGQGFGQNMVRYKSLDFEVLSSPHIQLFHHSTQNQAPKAVLNRAEEWYRYQKEVFQSDLPKPRGIVLYQNYPAFQQNAFPYGLIPERGRRLFERTKKHGTLTHMYTHNQTDKLLGENLVQAFIYHQIQKKDSLPSKSFHHIPNWLTEGLKTYLVYGPQYLLGSMWMRDHFSSGKDLSMEILESMDYEPSPYGHSFWAYLVGKYGHQKIPSFLHASARYGVSQSIQGILGERPEEFFNQWKTSIYHSYDSLLNGYTWARPLGKPLATQVNAGNINTAPALSPNGKFLAFLTEKEVVTTQLYISDTETGRILHKFPRENKAPTETYKFQESQGSWSPDNRRFIVPVISKGINKLLLIELGAKNKTRLLTVPGLTAFSHPYWGPKGEKVVFSGLEDGVSDLYIYEVQKEKISRLTQDSFSDIHPAWSPDGSRLVFASDRLEDSSHLQNATLSLFEMELPSREIRLLPVFLGAQNTNPSFGSDSEEVFFLSDRDGLRNLYSFNLQTREVAQRSHFFTGIGGLSPFSQAISLSSESEEIAYSLFERGSFSIYKASVFQFPPSILPPDKVDPSSSLLPGSSLTDLPGSFRVEHLSPHRLSDSSLQSSKYFPKFHLSYAGNSGAGFNLGGNFNPGPVEGVKLLFTDVLGHHQFLGSFSINGKLFDLGGQISYLNQKHTIKWGLGLSRMPFRVSDGTMRPDSLVIGEEVLPVNHLKRTDLRQFEDELSLFLHYPLSRYIRLEAGISQAWYHSRTDEVSTYFDPYGNFIEQERSQQNNSKQSNLRKLYLAYVGDKATFGANSPLDGWRYRIHLGSTLGEFHVHTLSSDLRFYHFFKPFSLGLRTSFQGRFGADAENELFAPLFLGFPGNVHGFFGSALDQQLKNGTSLDQLSGSKTWVTNVEFRLPFTGPKGLTFFPSRFFLSDWVLFMDGGMAWDTQHSPSFNLSDTHPDKRVPLFSCGVALRANLFGIIGVEPYYAIPIIDGRVRKGVLGLNFLPGW